MINGCMIPQVAAMGYPSLYTVNCLCMEVHLLLVTILDKHQVHNDS